MLSAGTDIGGGVWELTQAELPGLTVTPAANSGDDISISIEATTVEPANGDTATTTQTGTIPVNEVADAAVLSVANATGDEDSAIVLPGLSAALFDTDGSEVLSVTLANVPEGSILSAGANNGDGTWTINPADLAGLSITPPANWSGSVNLELVAFTLEPNGNFSQTSAPFTLTVNPVADSLVLTSVPRQGDAGTPIALDLQIAPGDDTGITPGENPPETLVVVLSGPASFIATSSGGVLEQTAPGEWTFTGSTADANSLAITPYGATDAFDLGVSVTMVDGSSTATPVVVDVPITVTNPGLDVIGDGTDETLAGGAGADLIAGGGGADVLTGDAGPDLFVWQPGDLAGGVVDQITDFDASQDVLDLAALLTAYDPASDAVADFVALSESGGNTTVSIDQVGGGNHTIDVVELSGVTGLDLASLIASSNITV
jgi:Ca2+-binding RTX toxin-like protein